MNYEEVKDLTPIFFSSKHQRVPIEEFLQETQEFSQFAVYQFASDKPPMFVGGGPLPNHGHDV